MDQAKEQVEKLSRDAVDGLKTLGMKNEFLEELILYLIHREK